MASPDLPIILYHYPESPYARKIVWYLALRAIPYSSCVSESFLGTE
jgi:glutathione S-transferase